MSDRLTETEEQADIESERAKAGRTKNRSNPPLAYSSESHWPSLSCITLQRDTLRLKTRDWETDREGLIDKGIKRKAEEILDMDSFHPFHHQQVSPVRHCVAVSCHSGISEPLWMLTSPHIMQVTWWQTRKTVKVKIIQNKKHGDVIVTVLIVMNPNDY